MSGMKPSRTAGVLLLLAFGLITTGLTLIYVPLGFISGGTFLLLMAYAYHAAEKERKAEATRASK
jgi:hypothetical protein